MSEKAIDIERSEQEIKESPKNTLPRRIITPKVDIYETNDAIVVVANIPGVSEEKVDITLENNQLSVVGEVTQEAIPGYKLVYGEQYVRSYKRTFTLTDKVDRDSIVATLNQGVLTLTLTKAPIAQVRQISVQAAS